MSMTLVFNAAGTAVLEEDNEITWSSDDDLDFIEENGDDILDEEDSTMVLNYLKDSGIITEHEAQMCAIEVDDKTTETDDGQIVDADYEVE